MATDSLVMVGDFLESGESVEEALDRLAAESPYGMGGGQDGDGEGSGRGKMVAMVRYLVELRVRDEQAFDLLCLKIIHPEMTHEKLAAILQAGGKVTGASRVRSYERWKRLAEEHPELAEVVSFDRRGGDQRGGTMPATGAEVLFGDAALREGESPWHPLSVLGRVGDLPNRVGAPVEAAAAHVFRSLCKTFWFRLRIDTLKADADNAVAEAKTICEFLGLDWQARYATPAGLEEVGK